MASRVLRIARLRYYFALGGPGQWQEADFAGSLWVAVTHGETHVFDRWFKQARP